MKVNPIEMQKCLGGVDYPASKDDIVSEASRHGAGKDIMDALKKLPAKEYPSPAEVSKEIGKEV
ncbi:DUF2795 domain-containing protein [Streptomyces sp. NPDC059649]|uniref:DUF2795 domain-containing protein n=1 Tax=Streptomyces sp. NPDC059649 TaxID=3346895 RepID=UPI0036C33E39